jgi:hypothetical protein
MTEPQPSRSVKRPTQSLSKRARFIEAGSRLDPALPPNPPGLGLPEPGVRVRERHQFLIRPIIYATSSPVGRFSAGIGGGNQKFWGKLVFVGTLTWSKSRSQAILRGKESLKINKLAQILIEKVLRLFRDPALANPPLPAAAGQSMASAAFSKWRLVNASRNFSMARLSI